MYAYATVSLAPGLRLQAKCLCAYVVVCSLPHAMALSVLLCVALCCSGLCCAARRCVFYDARWKGFLVRPRASICMVRVVRVRLHVYRHVSMCPASRGRAAEAQEGNNRKEGKKSRSNRSKQKLGETIQTIGSGYLRTLKRWNVIGDLRASRCVIRTDKEVKGNGVLIYLESNRIMNRMR